MQCEKHRPIEVETFDKRENHKKRTGLTLAVLEELSCVERRHIIPSAAAPVKSLSATDVISQTRPICMDWKKTNIVKKISRAMQQPLCKSTTIRSVCVRKTNQDEAD